MAFTGYLPPVVAEIVAETGKFTAGMTEAKAQVEGLQGVVNKFAAVGKVAFAGVAVAAAAIGYESVKLAANFDQTMELIHTQAGASQSEVDSLKNSVLALAPAVGVGPEKLAEGLYHIESSGLRGAQALDVLTASAKLSKIGMADLDDVTYAMSGVMAIGMKDIHNATDAIAFMNATVGMGDMRMEQLAAAIGTGILPSFKSAGLGMVDFSAALAALADNSTPADEAATRLRMTIAMMAAPSGPARDALESIGLSATSLATDLQKPDGLLVAVQDLKTHLEKSGKSAVEQNAIMERAFGGGKTSGAILTLLEEVDKLKSKYDQLGTSVSRAAGVDQAWQDQQQQAKQKWDQLVARVEAYGVKIGNWLIPKIEDAMDWMGKHKKVVEDLAYAIGTVLTVAVAAYTAKLVLAGIANIAATWEFLVLAAAIGFTVYELIQLNDWLKQSGISWGDFVKLSGYAIDKWVYDHIAPAYNKLVDLANLIDRFTGGKGNTPHLAPPGVPNTNVGGAVQGQGRLINGAGYFPSFADGGVMPGPLGQPGLAIVHGGETITPAGGGGDIVIHQTIVTPDGQVLRKQQLRYARRSGLKPNELYPATAGQF